MKFHWERQFSDSFLHYTETSLQIITNKDEVDESVYENMDGI